MMPQWVLECVAWLLSGVGLMVVLAAASWGALEALRSLHRSLGVWDAFFAFWWARKKPHPSPRAKR